MPRRPLLLPLICLALVIAASEATVASRQADAPEYAAKAAKAAERQSAVVSKKERAQAPAASAASGAAKKASKKNGGKVRAKAESAKAKSAKAKDPKKRKYKKSGRDPAGLPAIDEAFAEAPDVVLTALSTIPTDGSISSQFGMRRLSGKKKRVRMHAGVDITAERGTPVLAAASGVVCFVGRWSSYGGVVEIDHGNGLVTRYAHLDSYLVEKDAAVASGEHIGNVGRSGRATGAHLHFETLVNGRAVDPMMAEMWRQTPEQSAAKRGMYVSGLGADPENI